MSRLKEQQDHIDLMHEIAGFTSLRDADLLELSLLKSIYGIVAPVRVSISVIDRQNIVIKQVEYSAHQHKAIASRQSASQEFIVACDQLDHSGLEYSTVTNEAGHTVCLFLLSESRKATQYIAIELIGASMAKTDVQQILGMLKIYRNFRQLLNEAQTDELTGLSNRKTFEHVCRKIHESVFPTEEPVDDDKRGDKQEGSYWLALADIDFFKRINDEHGHLMGDEVLVRIAQTFRASTRENDLIFRYGGEEFALILRAKNRDNVHQMLERVRLAVANIDIPQLGHITVSMGVVELSPTTFHLTQIDRADKALYASKNNGRNQITFFTELPSTEAFDDSPQEAELF